MGQMWRDADEAAKEQFIEMARKDKERYEGEKALIPVKPKRGLSAFMFFLSA